MAAKYSVLVADAQVQCRLLTCASFIPIRAIRRYKLVYSIQIVWQGQEECGSAPPVRSARRNNNNNNSPSSDGEAWRDVWSYLLEFVSAKQTKKPVRVSCRCRAARYSACCRGRSAIQGLSVVWSENTPLAGARGRALWRAGIRVEFADLP
ncbi:hypothetical protein LZ30DRAFT_719916 [Colletotrichum cereale]|nr:hypothetical protein LZ30DRAFT_719916 [Colletotrichum cereale]